MVLAIFVGSCAQMRSYRRCDEPLYPAKAARLSETGFFTVERIAYRPKFELWSDGAAKERWISLPAGAAIDTSDPDAWRFPVGAKLFKSFSRGGVLVETRVLEKVGEREEAWTAAAYVWNGEDAFLARDGVVDARGTEHDVPTEKDCMGCHGGTKSRVLGFSAVQLDPATLAKFFAFGAFREEPRAIANDDAVAGYLHANCAHCHNQRRPERRDSRCFDPERTFDLSITSTGPKYRSAIGEFLEPGDPEGSALFKRVAGSHVFRARMPPLGTEVADDRAIAELANWITQLKR